MSRILMYNEEAYIPEEMLPEEAQSWARYMVGTTRVRLDSWRKTKVNLWRTGNYGFYKLD
jgi:hypothetical protein